MRARGFTVPQLGAAVALLLIAALVVPAVAATIVHRRRVARAVADVTRIAAVLRESSREAGAEPSPLSTLAGPGDMPKSPKFPEWLTGRSEALNHATGVDPWGNRYLVNIGAARGLDALRSGAPPARAIWALSAGANGIIETPFDQPGATATVGGDDVAVRVWR
jgi:type II secretory pathway pseudopilin PulG